MGSIKPNAKGIVVEFSIEELIRRQVIIHLPEAPPPDKDFMFIHDHIGNMISRTAFEILCEKMSADKIGSYDSVKIEGGPVKITFYNKE